MKCPRCANKIPDSAKFCTFCGVNILKEKEEAEKNKIVAEVIKEETNQVIDDVPKNEVKKEIENENIEEKKTESGNEDNNQKEKPKKKTKTKKKHTLIKLIVILVLLLVIICACIYGLHRLDILPETVSEKIEPVIDTVEGWFGIEEDSEEELDKKTNENNKNKKDEKIINKKDEDEDLVYDYYNKTIHGNTFKIPAINLDYENIENINEEIADLIEVELKKYERGQEPPEGAFSSSDYIWAINDNILSLVFFISGYHVDNYYVYNVDIYSGDNIENSEILEAAKIDSSDFAEKCSEAVEDYYEKYLYTEDAKEAAGNLYKNALINSTDEYNFSPYRTKIYLNSYGELTIVAEIETIAGAGTNSIIVNIENLKRNSKEVFENTNARGQKNATEVENNEEIEDT